VEERTKGVDVTYDMEQCTAVRVKRTPVMNESSTQDIFQIIDSEDVGESSKFFSSSIIGMSKFVSRGCGGAWGGHRVG
jgi:hypothetical protein